MLAFSNGGRFSNAKGTVATERFCDFGAKKKGGYIAIFFFVNLLDYTLTKKKKTTYVYYT